MTDYASVAERLYTDFPAYCRSCLVIEDKDGAVVPFELNDAQMIVYRVMKAQEDAGLPVRVLLLKGRQQGASTISQAWLAHKAFTRPSRCFTIGHKLGPAGELFGKIELFYENLPEPFRPRRDAKRGGRRLKLAAPLRSLLVVESAEDDESAGRSGTFQHVHMTEIPFWKNQDTTVSAIEGSVPHKPGTSVIIESTARGKGNWFHKKWVDCVAQLEKGEQPEYYPVFVPWYASKEYRDPWIEGTKPFSSEEKRLAKEYGLDREQVLWYRRMAQKHGELVSQEFPHTADEAFLSSGLPFFHGRDLEFYEQKLPEEPLRQGEIVKRLDGTWQFEDNPRGRLHIFRLPNPNHTYVVGGDVSGGRARDFSFAQVLDCDTDEQVATWQGKIDPADFAYILANLGLMFRGKDDYALVVPERNNVGLVTVDRLVNEIHYPSIYHHVRVDTETQRESEEYGWNTTVRTRPTMLEDLQHAVHHRDIDILCRRTLGEMSSFVYTDDTGKKAEADAGCNDDAVMSLAITWAARMRAGGEVDFSIADDQIVGLERMGI